jgi:hypothetical protein
MASSKSIKYHLYVKESIVMFLLFARARPKSLRIKKIIIIKDDSILTHTTVQSYKRELYTSTGISAPPLQ